MADRGARRGEVTSHEGLPEQIARAPRKLLPVAFLCAPTLELTPRLTPRAFTESHRRGYVFPWTFSWNPGDGRVVGMCPHCRGDITGEVWSWRSLLREVPHLPLVNLAELATVATRALLALLECRPPEHRTNLDEL